MREIAPSFALFLAVLGVTALGAGCGSGQARPAGPPPEYEEPDAGAAPRYLATLQRTPALATPLSTP
jgi:hypothetical protein